ASMEGAVGGSGYSVPESLAGDPRTVELVRDLLGRGNAEISRESLKRAMVVAAVTGTSMAVDMLLSLGVEVGGGDVLSEEGDPIYNAVVGGHVEVLELLLGAGANASARLASGVGNSLLHLAAENGDPFSIRALVRAGAEVDARNGDDATPLMQAVAARGRTAVTTLIELGADVGGKDWLGRDALEVARRLDPADEWLVEVLEKAKVK
ncbi:MAG: ankyrin repeat domain-containing protein, partial [Verrucomicrobiales bacterium]|nr:ankyrin repeat domain-containing protein [Verrucomicrobiales bacterium]